MRSIINQLFDQDMQRKKSEKNTKLPEVTCLSEQKQVNTFSIIPALHSRITEN